MGAQHLCPPHSEQHCEVLALFCSWQSLCFLGDAFCIPPVCLPADTPLHENESTRTLALKIHLTLLLKLCYVLGPFKSYIPKEEELNSMEAVAFSGTNYRLPLLGSGDKSLIDGNIALRTWCKFMVSRVTFLKTCTNLALSL